MEATMQSTLPAPLAAYLKAKQHHDGDALLATLTDDVVITDEGREFPGSPVTLYFHAALRDGRIAALTVLP
jgi:hypothetical protein